MTSSEPLAPLPLPLTALPEGLQRFANEAAPERARTMAAKGLVPVKGGDLVVLLLQLAADASSIVAETAKQTLTGLPRPVLETACEAELHPSMLDALAERVESDIELIERIVANHATHDETIVRVAGRCPDRICERIAVNEERVLRAPEIVAALYRNKATRMSTVDRLIELAVRNGVKVEGIPHFEEHAKAIEGELIFEPTEELLPGDAMFAETTVDEEESAIDQDVVDGTETVKDKHLPLSHRIAQMKFHEKLRACLVGNAPTRSLLVRDSNRIVAMAAVSSPLTTEAEAAGIATSRQVAEEVLRFIGNRRERLGNYDIKKSLVFNPKTPIGVSMKFLSHMHVSDLRNLSRSRGIPQALKTAAIQRVMKKGA